MYDICTSMLGWTHNELRARVSFVGLKLFEIRNKSGKRKECGSERKIHSVV